MKLRTLLLVVSLLPTIVLASDWQYIASTSDESITVYIDKESIRFDGNKTKAWEKWIFITPQKVVDSYPEKSYLIQKDLRLYNCKNSTTALVSTISYASENGEVVDTFSWPENQLKFTEFAPDSIGEEITKEVCKQKPKRKK